MWSILENKIPMWDNLQKRQFNGAGWCLLCKEQAETIDHLFMRCPFSLSVWAESNKLLTSLGLWQGLSFEDALKDWLLARAPQENKSFPFIVA